MPLIDQTFLVNERDSEGPAEVGRVGAALANGAFKRPTLSLSVTVTVLLDRSTSST
jgi:hypothetical protein